MTIPKPVNVHLVLHWEQIFHSNGVSVVFPQLTDLTECKSQ